MKHAYILIYYKVDTNNKLVLSPMVYEAKNDNDAVSKRNHLIDLGFRCEYYIFD